MKRLIAGVIPALAGLTILIFVAVSGAAVTETREGTFILKCPPTHVAQIDPIVNPGPPGTLSAHPHQFFANRSTASNSTLATMRAATTSCPVRGDTAGYWEPTLLRPDGSIVVPVTMFAYYKNKPVTYGTTQAFPPDFRMIAGGPQAPTRVFWAASTPAGATTTRPSVRPVTSPSPASSSRTAGTAETSTHPITAPTSSTQSGAPVRRPSR